METWRATQEWVTAATRAEQQAWAVGREGERRPANRGETRGCCVYVRVCVCVCTHLDGKIHVACHINICLRWYFSFQGSSMLLSFSLQSAESGCNPLQVCEEEGNTLT